LNVELTQLADLRAFIGGLAAPPHCQETRPNVPGVRASSGGIDQAVYVEELGYGTIWITEH
jgi:hypothetical protein